MWEKIISCYLLPEYIWRKLRKLWKRALGIDLINTPTNGRSLIIPCDPWTVVGSRGDQAMLLACVQHIRERDRDCAIDIMTDDTSTHEECKAMGLTPQATWNVPMDLWFAAHGGEYAEVYILGADVTDGVYGWPTACKLLAYYDLFSRLSTLHLSPTPTPAPQVHYLGFSWSKTPAPMMRRVIRKLAKGLPLPVRDPISLERLSKFTRHRPLVQVADVAFCMKPRSSERVLAHREWVEAQRSAGKRVLALNVHTMFNEEETKSADWELAISSVLKSLLLKYADIQLLLLPHDNRPGRSDLVILKRLCLQVDSARVYLVDEVMNADEIKALVGVCDGLIAGRMHLSIAALGSGVPALGLTYQGKFEGLWKLFDLPETTLMSPKLFLVNADEAIARISSFVDSLASLKQQITVALPNVLSLSKKNFDL